MLADTLDNSTESLFQLNLAGYPPRSCHSGSLSPCLHPRPVAKYKGKFSPARSNTSASQWTVNALQESRPELPTNEGNSRLLRNICQRLGQLKAATQRLGPVYVVNFQPAGPCQAHKESIPVCPIYERYQKQVKRWPFLPLSCHTMSFIFVVFACTASLADKCTSTYFLVLYFAHFGVRRCWGRGGQHGTVES